MINNQHQFERLLSVEDEELSSEAAIDDIDSIDHNPERDSCRVPMIGSSSTIDQQQLIKQLKQYPSEMNRPKTSNIEFTLNGRHIKINSEHLKYISLITLTIQNAALNLTMRAAKTQPEKFSNAVAVTVSEILKFFTCLVFLWYEDNFCLDRTIQSIRVNILNNYMDTLKVAVPSLVYYIQNNLLYVASTHLDAATGQVIYQLKILTTAIFSVTMLGKRLTKIQWLSLVILFLGVALIERLAVSEPNNIDKISTTNDLNTNNSHHSEAVPRAIVPKDHENPTIGFMAVLIACCLSGFAGVYFEKILKNSNVSLWIRNIQLSFLSIPFGLFQVFIIDYADLSEEGFWKGFTPLTWLCILLQVQGGLLVALVVKFANNILKGFATSLAIVISTLASIFLFQFQLTPGFMLGASLVIGSVMMYSKQ